MRSNRSLEELAAQIHRTKGALKLNLGCGNRFRDECINVDVELGDKLKYENPILVEADIFEFLQYLPAYSVAEAYFDYSLAHVWFDKLSYLFYLLAKVCIKGAQIEILEDDAELVIKHIDPKSWSELECLHYSLLSPDSPHKSIWTKSLAKLYIEPEGYFRIISSKHGVGIREVGMIVLATRTEAYL